MVVNSYRAFPIENKTGEDMKISTSYLTHRTHAEDSNQDFNHYSPADLMARKACEKAASKQNAVAFTMSNEDVLITAVSAALSRALNDPKFNALPEKQKTEAASRLAEQFMHGQRLVQALTSAMNNPSTLAAQLKYNSHEGEEVSVFDTIIDSARPKVTPESSEMAFIGMMQ
jgi:hypothetical protein